MQEVEEKDEGSEPSRVDGPPGWTAPEGSVALAPCGSPALGWLSHLPAPALPRLPSTTPASGPAIAAGPAATPSCRSRAREARAGVSAPPLGDDMTRAHPGPPLGPHSRSQMGTTPPSPNLDTKTAGAGEGAWTPSQERCLLRGTEAWQAQHPSSHLPSLPTVGTEAPEGLKPTQRPRPCSSDTERLQGGPTGGLALNAMTWETFFSSQSSSHFPPRHFLMKRFTQTAKLNTFPNEHPYMHYLDPTISSHF